jgi:hypothetical protein
MSLFVNEWKVSSINYGSHPGWQIQVRTSHDPLVDNDYEVCYRMHNNEFYFSNQPQMGSISTNDAFEALSWAMNNLRRFHKIA